MTTSPHPPLQHQDLQWKAVLLQALDRDHAPINGGVASGFLVKEGEKIFLYTAWHVVTGFDLHDLNVPLHLPRRRWLRVSLQDYQTHQIVSTIGGVQTVELPLYQDTLVEQGRMRPLWLQGDQHIAHELLNPVGLFVPFWHDLVKLEMPDGLPVHDLQLLGPWMQMPGTSLVVPGDKCLVVGYPYGFSAAIAVEQPTPIVLTRFVASTHIAGKRNRELLLDGYGAPSMSGCPVFLERDRTLYLLGVYTGVIHPGHQTHDKDKATALATVAPLSMYLWGHRQLVREPSSPLTSTGYPVDPPVHSQD